jgi:hypothetical protein
MTYNPATLQALGSYWTGHGGVNLGVVGDTSHVSRGTSYHLGKDQLVADAYSIRTARDKAGLTNAASAIDLGRLNGSFGPLRTFSIWLVAEARSDAPGTSDIREIIYSPDGVKVLRWDRERGYASAPREGEADSSHLTHTHISWYRDAEARDHRTAFRPYFEKEEIVNSFPVPKVPSVGDVVKGTTIYPTDAMSATDPDRIIIDPARSFPYVGIARSGVAIVEYVNESGVHSGKAYFLPANQLTNIRPVLAPAPDCTKAVADATAPLKARITELEGQVVDAVLAGARAEWDRQATGATVVPKLLDRP